MITTYSICMKCWEILALNYNVYMYFKIYMFTNEIYIKSNLYSALYNDLLESTSEFQRSLTFLLGTKIYRGSYMSTHVLLNLLNELGKRDKMRSLTAFYLFFATNLINSIIQERILLDSVI